MVYTFGNEIGRIDATAVEGFFIFERIVNLSIRHGTGVEPNVDKVAFALHGQTAFAHQNDVVYVRTVQVDFVVIGFIHVAGNEAQFLVGIFRHEAGSHRFFNFVVQFFERTDANFFAAVAVAPNGQRCSPVTRTAQVPVVEVFQPFAETACSRRFGLPKNGIVEFHHAFATRSGANEPAVERIVQHGLVGAPAVRIIVHVLFHFQSLTGLLHFQSNLDIQIFGFGSSHIVVFTIDIEFGSVSILHISTFVMSISGFIYTSVHESGRTFFEQIIFTGHIHHRTGFAQEVDHEK